MSNQHLVSQKWWNVLFRNGPYAYQRKPIPQPGAENVAFATLALPEVSPINGALHNLRDFIFSDTAYLQAHMTGLQGYGGIPNAENFSVMALTDTNTSQPVTVVEFMEG